jgi:hypothetical protein
MIPDPDDDTTEQASPFKIFTSAVHFWLPFANTKLKTIYDTQFGTPTVTAAANKIYRFGQHCMVLALFHSCAV